MEEEYLEKVRVRGDEFKDARRNIFSEKATGTACRQDCTT